MGKVLHVVQGPREFAQRFLACAVWYNTTRVAQRVPAFLLHGSKQQPALLGSFHTIEP